MKSDRFDAERRRRNVRAAWVLGGVAMLIAATSVPFWKGLFMLVNGSPE